MIKLSAFLISIVRCCRSCKFSSKHEISSGELAHDSRVLKRNTRELWWSLYFGDAETCTSDELMAVRIKALGVKGQFGSNKTKIQVQKFKMNFFFANLL